MKNKIFLLIICSITTLVILISGCIDDTGRSVVIKGKDNNFQTIMDAINESLDGDTILVGKGIYNEKLIIDKSIKLIGENKEVTIINGNKTGDVIYVLADNVTISGFTIQNSGEVDYPTIDSGIDIRSDNNTIKENIISSNNNSGIYIYSSINNNINNNSINGSKYGVYLSRATENYISSNIISSNFEFGIYLSSLSDYNTITDNIFSENKYGGRIKGSRKNIISRNLIKNNIMGLYFCCGGENNTIYQNIFINNTEWHAKGYPINQWDDGLIGNYWDDYNGSDKDKNGIGDVPYVIVGYVNQEGINEDRYPLIELTQIKK